MATGDVQDRLGPFLEDLQQHRFVRAVGQPQAGLCPLGPLAEQRRLPLEALDQGRDLVQVAPHLLLLVAAAGDLERVARDVVAVGGIGHANPDGRTDPGC